MALGTSPLTHFDSPALLLLQALGIQQQALRDTSTAQMLAKSQETCSRQQDTQRMPTLRIATLR
jgi:hypothetical protein